ncbi:MAG: hypothetical protein R2867_13100 [Caldilineaceae bacterium]
MRRHHLEAVVTLNKELFQPYSGVAAHLMVVQKTDSTVVSPDLVWFGDVNSDGYPTGAGRDLTAQQDSATNELPRMRDLVLRTRATDWDLPLMVTADTHLRILLLQPEDGLPGIGLMKEGPATMDWRMSALPSGILATITQADAGTDSTLPTQLYLPYQANTPIVLLPEQRTEVNWSTKIPCRLVSSDSCGIKP